MPEPVHPSIALPSARKWAITGSVMLVTIMQILDTSITNVALPHMQGTLSTSVEETSWVITSYLAANAIVIPATGWLTGMFDGVGLPWPEDINGTIRASRAHVMAHIDCAYPDAASAMRGMRAKGVTLHLASGGTTLGWSPPLVIT